MKDLTHERCSELLEAYVSGTLVAPEQGEVDRHLRSCTECSGELEGMLALRAPQVVPLTGPERDALSAAVRAAVLTPPKHSPREWLGRRMAPALGAVALLAIALVAIVSVSDEGPIPAAQQGADESAEEEATTEDSFDRDGAAPRNAPAASKAKRQQVSAGTAGSAAGTVIESSDAMTAEGATLPNRSNFALEDRTFAQAGLEVGRLVPNRVPSRRAVDDLAFAAPDERLSRMVRECTELTVDTSPHPLVPASAAYYLDEVLVIGFVWVEETTATLNYELRGWVGGRCDQVSPIYRRGLVE